MGILQQLIFSVSFETAKPSPIDLDLVLTMATDYDPTQGADSLTLFVVCPSARFCRRADVLWTTAAMPAETPAV